MSKLLLTIVSTCLISSPLFAHEHGQDHDNDKMLEGVTIENIVDGLDMIQAGGGNIAVLHGDDGVFVIDNGLPDKTDAVMSAIKKVAKDENIKMLVNTHWHFDHTGNNADISKSGAIIIAHNNVRKRLEAGQMITALGKRIEPADASALPILTYDEGVNIHLNGQSASVMKMGPAHTDGDSVIYWRDANVIHTGDIFFSGKFPFIDESSGGSLAGMIEATDKILAMINDQTKIIPGHGPLSSKENLATYNAMLKDVSERLKKAKDEGKTRESWLEANPLADLKDQWGGGFMNVDQFTEIVWDTDI